MIPISPTLGDLGTVRWAFGKRSPHCVPGGLAIFGPTSAALFRYIGARQRKNSPQGHVVRRYRPLFRITELR
jgi:hypothetical protein